MKKCLVLLMIALVLAALPPEWLPDWAAWVAVVMVLAAVSFAGDTLGDMTRLKEPNTAHQDEHRDNAI